MRKTLSFLSLVAVLVLLSGTASAQEAGLDVVIEQECDSDYEPLVSMTNPDETFNNPGVPGFYTYDVCVQGIRDSTITETSCDENTGFHMFSDDERSHFSTDEVYNLNVCTGQMATSVQPSCGSNQTTIMSVSDDHNAHIAGPGVFDQHLCGFIEAPTEVSVTLSFESEQQSVYFDGEEVDGSQSFSIAEYPYIISEDGGIVQGLVASDFQSADRFLNGQDEFVLRRESDSASFFVPFTQGDRFDIENRQEAVLGNEFTNLLNPSFAFFIPDTPTIKIALDPDAEVESELNISAGSYTLVVRKTDDNQVEILTR